MKIQIVTEDMQTAAILGAAEADTIALPAEGEDLPAADKYIVVGDRPYETAEALADRGIDDLLIDLVDVTKLSDGWDAAALMDVAEFAAEAEDIYYADVHSLADHVPDPEDLISIEVKPTWARRHIRWRLNELCVAAGPYSCGKSILMQHLGYDWCEGDGARFQDGHERAGEERPKPVWFCTWEDDPVEQNEQIERYVLGCSIAEHKGPSDKQLERVEKLKRMVQYTDARTVRGRGIDWFITRARYLHRKYGTNFLVLDPWSEFDHDMDIRQLETQYVKKMMFKFAELARELKLVVIIITHVGKAKYADDMGIKPFRVADAMGSVQFGSSATRGFCVTRTSTLGRDDRDHTVVYMDKIKREGLKKMGVAKEIVALTFEPGTFQFQQSTSATMDAAEVWGCRCGGLLEGKMPEKDDPEEKPKPAPNGKTYSMLTDESWHHR